MHPSYTKRKKWEHNGAVHQISVEFKKAYNSMKSDILCNILIHGRTKFRVTEFGVDINIQA
jgi:hypothetical protein